MITLQTATWQAAVLGRWTARILGTLAVLFFLALVFGEGPPNPLTLTLRENLSFLCMTALFAGLAFAWYREGWGGAITAAAFTGLALIDPSHLRMPALQIPLTIGLLHLICWSRLRTAPPDPVPSLSISRGLLLAGGAAVGLFLLLCANEIFGNPPLMTPTLRPGSTLIGTWQGPEGAITIQQDGSITGALTGTIRYNRSWFGKAMNWRTDYLIAGMASGRTFTAPLRVTDSELDGSLFFSMKEGPRPLHLRRIQSSK